MKIKNTGVTLVELLLAGTITIVSVSALGVLFYRAQQRTQDGNWIQMADLEIKRLLAFAQRQYQGRMATSSRPLGYRLLETPIAGLYPRLELTRNTMEGGMWPQDYAINLRTLCRGILSKTSGAPTEVNTSSCLSCQPGDRTAIVFPSPESTSIPPPTVTLPDTDAYNSYRALSGAFCVSQTSAEQLQLTMELYLWLPTRQGLHKVSESISVPTALPNAELILEK